MSTYPVEPLETLGQRLTRQATRLMSAHTPAFAWLRPMQDLLEHLASLPGPTAERFDRVEADGALVVFHDRVLPSGKMIDGNGEVSAGRRLPSDVQAQLRRVIGRDAATMRVHDDAAADTIARTHRADAVSIGRQVYFRQGRFRPREPHGFGLIAHEATHVAEFLAPGGRWRRLTGSGRRHEEHLAEANERRGSRDSGGQEARIAAPPQRLGQPRAGLLGLIAVAQQQGQPPAAVPATAPAEAPAQPAAQPMLAAEDRDAATAASIDMEALRRSLFHDLKDQLQTEFERGA